MKILTGKTNKILRTKSRNIPKITKELKSLAKKMIEACEEKGVGLAAPQIGKNIRMFVAKIKGRFSIFVNPEILEYSLDKMVAEEGCLSLPGLWGDVERSRGILLKFGKENGQKMTLKFSGIQAKIIQHEIDHLDGILFVDKVIGEVRREEKRRHTAYG